MKLFKSNELSYRLLRTIIQGVIGVIIANLDTILMHMNYIPGIWRPLIVALVMAVLSPIMAALGKDEEKKDE